MQTLRRFRMLAIGLFHNDRGTTLGTSLILLAVLTLTGTMAILMSLTDTQISSNYKASLQAFYAAEAGLEEARARLRTDAGADRIPDPDPTNPAWRAFIGDPAAARARGYDPHNANHTRVDQRYQDATHPLTYTVVIEHATDASGKVLYWGDPDRDGVNASNPISGETIYRVTSHGTRHNAYKTLQIEAARFPAPTVPAALYVKTLTGISGSDVHIDGTDRCVGPDLPAVLTPQPPGTVVLPALPFLYPSLTGSGGGPSPPDVVYNGTDMRIESMVAALKDFVTHTPIPQHGALTGYHWGTPILGATVQDPSTCTERNVVYIDAKGGTITLSDSTGCGLLLVVGNLVIDGPFASAWYGLILVTGNLTFRGEIGSIHITGAVLAGGTTDKNEIVSGTDIIYCSDAILAQTLDKPLRVFRWYDAFQ